MIGSSVGPYRVLECLGTGGMGEVFLADDTRLLRLVALKRLTGSLVDDRGGRRRILREARAVAQLHHPGIASIFDILDLEDSAWIVMEYVEGVTLAVRLQQGRLPVADAVGLGIQLADALANAHEHGILHCDLKPLNIRVTRDGRAKILDFGLAQRSADAVASDETEAASVGIGHRNVPGLSGTAGYMAPERLSGTPADVRGDIYSLGIVLFEMLTGRRPFGGSDLVSTAALALTTPAPSPSGLDAAIPEAVSAVVLKAIARHPDARYPGASALGAALRAISGESTSGASAGAAPGSSLPDLTPVPAARRPRWVWAAVAATALAAVAAGGGLAVWGWRLPERAAAPSVPIAALSIVVTPFSNVSGNPADEVLGSGFTDDLLMKLSLLPRVTVVSRETTAAYLAVHPASPNLARDLGAAHVVKGAIERDGDRLRVTVALVSPAGATTWTRTYDGTTAGLFSLQHQVAEGLADGLNLRLTTPDRQRLTAAPTPNIEAFADYSQGRLFLDRSDVKGNVTHAIEAFDRAVAKDASFAQAHAGLGAAYWQKFTETSETSWTLRAIDASLEALRLNPDQAEVRVTLATIYKGLGRTPAAVDELRKALALRPDDDEAYRLLGDIFAGQGRIDDAVQSYQRAIGIRPNYWQNHNRLAVALMSVGRYQEAEVSCRRVTELQPDSHIGFNNLGAVAMMQGNLTLALDSFARAAEIRPGYSTFSNMGTIHFWNGRFDEARKAYVRAIALRAGDPSLHRNLGDALAELRDAPGARNAYAQALELATRQLTVNPKDEATLSLMALIEAKLGRKADARAHVDQALALAPKGKDVYYRTAVVAALGNDPDAAIAALTTAVSLGYSAEQAARDLDLRSLRSHPEYKALMTTRKP